MTGSTRWMAGLALAMMLAGIAGCKTTVIEKQPLQQDHRDDNHDDHRQPPPPPPDHRDDHR